MFRPLNFSTLRYKTVSARKQATISLSILDSSFCVVLRPGLAKQTGYAALLHGEELHPGVALRLSCTFGFNDDRLSPCKTNAAPDLAFGLLKSLDAASRYFFFSARRFTKGPPWPSKFCVAFDICMDLVQLPASGVKDTPT